MGGRTVIADADSGWRRDPSWILARRSFGPGISIGEFKLLSARNGEQKSIVAFIMSNDDRSPSFSVV